MPSLLALLSFFSIGMCMYLPICGIVLGEMSIFIEVAPEGKTLAAITATAFSLTNVVPLLILVLHHYRKISDTFITILLQTIALADLLLLAFFWKWTTDGISAGIILCSIIGGIVGTTSVVVIFNVAAPYKPIYTSAMSAGLSGAAIITSLFALLQDVTSLAVSTYFFVLASLIPFAMIGLFLIQSDWLRQYILRNVEKLPDSYGSVQSEAAHALTLAARFAMQRKPLISMLISSFSNFLVMPAIFPYLCVSSYQVNIVTAVYSGCNFVGRILCGFIRHDTLYFCTFLQIVCTMYIFLATKYPMGGFILVNIVLGVFAGLNGYILTLAVVVAHNDSPHYLSSWSVRMTSGMLQLGNVLGGTLALGLVKSGVFDL